MAFLAALLADVHGTRFVCRHFLFPFIYVVDASRDKVGLAHPSRSW
jgi:hypothetical protein